MSGTLDDAADDLITVNIDVAGFYYRAKGDLTQGVKLPRGASVLDAMAATRARDMKAHMKGGTGPILDFSVEIGPTPGLFINEISVLHMTPATSRQESQPAGAPRRSYEAGRYAYADDPVDFDAVNNRLVRNDAVDLPYVLAWQYYLYDRDGRDLARVPKATNRKVVPASEAELDQDVTIVWRLIAIFLKPSERPGSKPVAAMASARAVA
jgi:hypothetical protein